MIYCDLRRLRPVLPFYLVTRLEVDLGLVRTLRHLGQDKEADPVLAENARLAEALVAKARPPVEWLDRWAQHLQASGEESDFHARETAAVETAYGTDSRQAQQLRKP